MADLPYEITAREAATRLAEETPTPRLIDCREEDEYAFNKVEGSQLVPLSKFGEIFESALGPDREQPILVYCHHGRRSMRATEFLRQKGYKNAQSISGGIDAWSLEIDESIPRY